MNLEQLQTAVHELSGQVAEMSETLAVLTAQVGRNEQLGVQIAELLQVLREQKPPALSVTVPPAPAPAINFEAPAAFDWEITTVGAHGKTVKSFVRRVPQGSLQ
jgi:hypothetical protein